MENRMTLFIGLAILVAATGCNRTTAGWRAEQVTTVYGLHVPESALYEPERGKVYVSNIESAPGEYWTDDGKGYITILREDNSLRSDQFFLLRH